MSHKQYREEFKNLYNCTDLELSYDRYLSIQYLAYLKACEKRSQEISELKQLLSDAMLFVDSDKYETYNFGSPIHYWVNKVKTVLQDE